MAPIHFIRPYILLGLIPVFVFIALLLTQRGKGSAWHRVCDAHLLPHLLLSSKQQRQWLPLTLLTITWIASVIALAGPSIKKQAHPVFRKTNSTVIALSMTPSLYASDLKPDRLTRAKYKILDLLKQQQEGQTALIVFTSKAFVVSPLTQDAATIAAMVPVLEPNIMPVGGEDISAGLKEAAKLIQQSGLQHGHIILLTDVKPTASDRQTATHLREQGIYLSVLGLGTAQGAPIPKQHGFAHNTNGSLTLSKLDAAALQKLASAGGGHYAQFTSNQQDIDTVLQQPSIAITSSQQKSEQKLNQWQDQGNWLVLLLLPFAALAFRRGWFERIVETS